MRATVMYGAGDVRIARLDRLAKQGVGQPDRLPMSRKVLLECALRNLDNYLVTEQHVRAQNAGRCR